MSGTRIESTMGHLVKALKTPTIGRVYADLASTARDEGWSHEEYLAAVLERQVTDREANGTALRVAGAHFPAVKTLEDFNTDYQPGLRRDVLAHLASCGFVAKAENVILLGPPGVGKPIWVSGWASRLVTPDILSRLTRPRDGLIVWPRRITVGWEWSGS